MMNTILERLAKWEGVGTRGESKKSPMEAPTTATGKTGGGGTTRDATRPSGPHRADGWEAYWAHEEVQDATQEVVDEPTDEEGLDGEEAAGEDNFDGEEAVDGLADGEDCTAMWQCDNHGRGCQAPGAAAAAEEAHWESEVDPDKAVDEPAKDEDTDGEEAADENNSDGEETVDKPADDEDCNTM